MQVPRRLAAAALALAVVTVGRAEQAGVRVRIVAPTAETYVSGAARLVAAIDPPGAAAEVAQVTFFADGRQVCAITRVPFECDCNAGEKIARV